MFLLTMRLNSDDFFDQPFKTQIQFHSVPFGGKKRTALSSGGVIGHFTK
jgi:hypothetical protein